MLNKERLRSVVTMTPAILKRKSLETLKPLRMVTPFTVRNALYMSIPTGILLTVIMLLGKLNTQTWTVSPDFHFVLTLSLNCALFFLLFLYVFSILKSGMRVAWRFALAIIGALVIAASFSLLSNWVKNQMYEGQLLEHLGDNVLKDSLIAVITILITVLIYMLSRRHQMEMENERLQSENLLVRYETLENQLDPHFLFNSLNTLSGLIGTDDEKAQAYLMQLASTYRYTIQQNKLVPLADELAFADAYLYMMNIRYGDSLTVVRHFDEVQSGYYVVPISVQLLIENAIKHNVVSNRHPLTITVASTGHGSLRVSNSMCPKEEDSTSEGIGLSNMDKRYELIAGEHISVSNDGTTFSVEIPLIPAQKAEAILAKLGEEMG
ncbi:MAG: histidine kinase [Bacteroidales bacterium]|nr:histidine kinase [Bacteroidales bacterium]